MGFKIREDKPYTKADHYREMEEKAARKRAAAFHEPFIISDMKDPAWLDEPQSIEEPSIVDETESQPAPDPVEVETKPKTKTQARKKTSSKKKVKKVENTNS